MHQPGRLLALPLRGIAVTLAYASGRQAAELASTRYLQDQHGQGRGSIHSHGRWLNTKSKVAS